MSARALLDQLKAQGIKVETRPNGNLHLTPKARVTPDLLEAVRQQKPALLALLPGNHFITRNSRNPLIDPEIRAKIEAIETDARTKGWPAELLWNNAFWDQPRGLAAVLEENDQIVEVTSASIKILKVKRDVLIFHRHVS